MNPTVLIWALALVAGALVFAIAAMQAEIKGWRRPNVYRILSVILSAGSGGWIGKSLVDLWYSSPDLSVPAEVWKGAFWILACLIGGLVIVAIIAWLSEPPKCACSEKKA